MDEICCLVHKAASQLNRELEEIDNDFRSGLPLLDSVRRTKDSILKSCIKCAEIEKSRGSDIKELQKTFQHVIEPNFGQSWFMYRARAKPRGYPGDFEILEGIYNHQTKTNNGIGKVLDEYFLQTELAKAVTGRMNYCRKALGRWLSSQIISEPDILNIACGPCRELRELDINCKERPFRYHGLDNDQAALDYAFEKSTNSGISRENLKFTKQNVLRLINPEYNIRNLGYYDLIYSVGLYDYLPDELLIRILKGTLVLLKETGEYLVAFKDSDKYDKTEYQWHVDWHFFQRTEQDCSQLLQTSGAKIVRLDRDESGIILLYTIKRE